MMKIPSSFCFTDTPSNSNHTYLYTASQEKHVSYMLLDASPAREYNQLSREGVLQRRVSKRANHGYSVYVNEMP